MNIEEVFQELGYKLVNHGNYYSTSALYRNGSSPTSLTIYPKNNLIIDWVTGQKFSLGTIVKASLNFNDLNQAEKWLEDRKVSINIEKPEPTLNNPKTFPIEWLQNLNIDHSYWINRGIDQETIKKFLGGIWTKDGAFKGYYVFPIFDSQDNLVGIAGRNLYNNLKPKWKLKGEKKLWKYPLFLNHEFIKKDKQVILVESIGNSLALTNAGCNNTMVLFGVDLSFEIINYFLKFDICNIIVATDNDGKAGNEAAQKIYKKLGKYFDRHLIKIAHPYKKDFCDQSKEENVRWIKEHIK